MDNQALPGQSQPNLPGAQPVPPVPGGQVMPEQPMMGQPAAQPPVDQPVAPPVQPIAAAEPSQVVAEPAPVEMPPAETHPEVQLEQIVESSGSSVIVDPPKAESDQAGEFIRKAEDKKKNKNPSKLAQKWRAMSKKKKRIVIIGGVAGLAVVISLLALVMSLTVLKIDYGESYRTAKELRIKVQKMRSDYECQKVIDYVDSAYTTMAAFNEYVEGCKSVGNDSDALVEELGLTDGVRKDDEIYRLYDLFKAAYEEAVSGGEDLVATLDLYTIWHSWVLASADVDGWDQTDTDLMMAASILIDSGDDVLKKYGDGWLSRRQAVAKAYRDYYVAGYDAENKEELRNDMQTKQKEFSDFEAEYKPNIKELQVLETADTAKLYTKFEEMYEVIRRAYQANYKRGSGDCKELISEIVCD